VRIHTPLVAVLMLLLGLGLTACNNNAYDDDVTADDDAADDDSAAGDDDDAGDDDSAGPAPQIFVDPNFMAFGSVCVGSSAMLPIAIANLGDAPLVVDAMQCPLPEVTFTPFSGQIPPSAQPVSVDITVNCSVEGALTGPLKIISNDPNRPNYNIPVEVSCDTC
jgi:hypothetical protein